MSCTIQAARSIPLYFHCKNSNRVCAVTGGCGCFSIPAPQQGGENDQDSSEVQSHKDELSGPGVWDCTKGYHVCYIFPTTSWYSTYLSWKGKDCQSEEQVEMPTYMKGLGKTKEWDREKKRLHAGQGHVGEPLYR